MNSHIPFARSGADQGKAGELAHGAGTDGTGEMQDQHQQEQADHHGPDRDHRPAWPFGGSFAAGLRASAVTGTGVGRRISHWDVLSASWRVPVVFKAAISHQSYRYSLSLSNQSV